MTPKTNSGLPTTHPLSPVLLVQFVGAVRANKWLVFEIDRSTKVAAIPLGGTHDLSQRLLDVTPCLAEFAGVAVDAGLLTLPRVRVLA